MGPTTLNQSAKLCHCHWSLIKFVIIVKQINDKNVAQIWFASVHKRTRLTAAALITQHFMALSPLFMEERHFYMRRVSGRKVIFICFFSSRFLRSVGITIVLFPLRVCKFSRILFNTLRTISQEEWKGRILGSHCCRKQCHISSNKSDTNTLNIAN